MIMGSTTPPESGFVPGELERRLEQAQADIAFLLARAGHAGSCSFVPGRWTGMSSNAIVAVAFGGAQTAMPSDRGDYAACVRTFARLPRHRRTEAVKEAMRKARDAYLARYPGDRYPAGRAAAEAEYQERRAEYERLSKAARRRKRA